VTELSSHDDEMSVEALMSLNRHVNHFLIRSGRGERQTIWRNYPGYARDRFFALPLKKAITATPEVLASRNTRHHTEDSPVPAFFDLKRLGLNSCSIRESAAKSF
jgi:hypothetical protein